MELDLLQAQDEFDIPATSEFSEDYRTAFSNVSQASHEGKDIACKAQNRQNIILYVLV